MRRQLFILLLLLFTHFLIVENACAQSLTTGESDFDKAKVAFAEIARKEAADREASPFHRACQGENDLYKRPVVTAFPSLDISDKYDQTSLQLMKAISKNVLRYTSENLASINEMERCLTVHKERADCAETQRVLTSDIPTYIKEARYHLSLAIDPTWSTDAFATRVNDDLKSLRSYKQIPWNPLTAEEKARSSKDLRNYYFLVSTSITTPFSHRRMKEMITRVKAIRLRHMDQYQMLLSEFPMMNYLKSARPSEAEIISAIRTMKIHAQKEVAELVKADKSLDTKVTSSSLIFLRYGSLVEGVLIEKPKLCGLAASMLDAARNRKIAKSAAIYLPILAASSLAPPIIPGVMGIMASIGISAAGSAGYAIAAQRTLVDSRDRVFNKLNSTYNEGPEKTKERVTRAIETPGAESTKEVSAMLERNQEVSNREFERNVSIVVFVTSPMPPPQWVFTKLLRMKTVLMPPKVSVQ